MYVGRHKHVIIDSIGRHSRCIKIRKTSYFSYALYCLCSLLLRAGTSAC